MLPTLLKVRANMRNVQLSVGKHIKGRSVGSGSFPSFSPSVLCEWVSGTGAGLWHQLCALSSPGSHGHHALTAAVLNKWHVTASKWPLGKSIRPHFSQASPALNQAHLIEWYKWPKSELSICSQFQPDFDGSESHKTCLRTCPDHTITLKRKDNK